ncbi:NUDIX hydrolase [Synechocystis salina LEGE 06155]|nr:NUDIX hydrolase [Synechocystis salina LEGE 06155]
MIVPNSSPRSLEIAPVIQQKLFYQGRKFNFDVSRRQLPNGVVGDWELIQHPGGALVVPITNEGQLVLVRQYRFALAARLLEFPAGTVEVGENPAATIKRELEEEAGYRGHTWQTIGQFPLAPGYSDEIIYAYLATDLEKLPHPPAQDEDEDIEVVLMTFDQFEAAIAKGEMVDAKSIASYFWMRYLL